MLPGNGSCRACYEELILGCYCGRVLVRIEPRQSSRRKARWATHARVVYLAFLTETDKAVSHWPSITYHPTERTMVPLFSMEVFITLSLLTVGIPLSFERRELKYQGTWL